MNIITMALNQFKMTIRNKLNFILLMMIPVLMIFVMGYALKPAFQANNTIEKFNVLYVNDDHGTIGKAFDNMLHKATSKYVHVVSTNSKIVQTQIDSGKYDEAIVISKNLSTNVLNGKNVQLEL